MAHVSLTRTWGKELGVEYTRETLPDGEELVLLDANEADSLYDGPDPRRTSLRLRRDAAAQQHTDKVRLTTDGQGRH
jgi:hypothetical protein